MTIENNEQRNVSRLVCRVLFSVIPTTEAQLNLPLLQVSDLGCGLPRPEQACQETTTSVLGDAASTIRPRHPLFGRGAAFGVRLQP